MTRMLVAMALGALLGAAGAPGAWADDGNLARQLDVDQQRERFARKLERLRAEARARGVEARQRQQTRAPAAAVPARSHRSMRLAPRPVPAPPQPQDAAAAPSAPRSELAQRREQALEARQRHRALVSGIDPAAVPNDERHARQRARTERRRDAFQRRLTP